MTARLTARARIAWLAGIGLALLNAVARAQVIDTIDVKREGSNAVVSIRFAAQIQYLRHAPLDRGDLIQVYFQFVGADESVLSTREETRRSPPNDLVPRFEVNYVAPTGIVQRRIDVRFAAPVEFALRPADNRTIAITVRLSAEALRKLAPAPAAPPAEAPRAAPPAAAAPGAPAAEARPEVAAEAAAAMATARDALRRDDFEAAILALNRVLNLPPNRESQEAQELIGVAREKLGELDKAKVEYELYLKLYPEGAGAARVRDRLAALGAAPAVAAPRPPFERPPGAPAYSAWGSFSQFYYGGQSRVQQTTTVVTPATGATTLETNALTATDQSQLITTADLNGRWQQGPWDNRVVFRDAYTANFLSGQGNSNRLYALYGETRYLPTNMLARAGRQIGTGAGVLGRYDGGLFNWGLRPDWRLGLIAGQLVDSPPGIHQSFVSASLDADNFLPNTNGQLFAVYQRVAGTTDRMGVGGEVRYFNTTKTAYGLFDYDPTFHAVNIASFQGTWQFPTGTLLNVLADYRRSPTLQLANVSVPEQTSDIGALIDAKGASALRDEAKAFTPISKVYLVGITQPFAEKWQFGFDFRISSLTGTPAIGVLPAIPGTGNIYTYTAQVIGTSLTRFQDILVVNGSVLRGSLLDGVQAGIDWRFVPVALLTVEPAFKYYHQTDNTGTRLTRFTPGIRLIYQLRERFSLEGEYDFERTRTSGETLDNLEYRHFFYLGWRWDF